APAGPRGLARHGARVHHTQVRLRGVRHDAVPGPLELRRQRLDLALIQAAAGRLKVNLHPLTASGSAVAAASSGARPSGPTITTSSKATTTGALTSILCPAIRAIRPCEKSASR